MSTPVRIFIGVDPGAKGACAVLACVDRPLDDSIHGKVAGFDVFDLPTVERADIGGSDLDVHAFVAALGGAIDRARDMAGDHNLSNKHAVVEFPDLGGQMKGGRRQAVVQGLNAGMAFAALVARNAMCVEWVASRSWRQELNLGETRDFPAACDVLGLPHDGNARVLCTHYGKGLSAVSMASPDRCVAVLLAEVLRRRWLGTAAVPKTKGAGQAAKARKSAERKAALARAVTPLTMEKARITAVEQYAPCYAHAIRGIQWRANCTPRNRCCEARLLDWAWRQRPEPSDTSLSLGTGWIELLPRVAAVYKKAVTSKAWTVAWKDSDETGTMDAKDFDALESHGLVQLQPGVKFVRYLPTERGLA